MNLKPLAGLTLLLSGALIWSTYDLYEISKFENYIVEPLKYQKIFFSHSSNIPALLISLINEETEFIKAAYYSFSLDSVADALIEAHHKGVKVEIIFDSISLKNKPALIEKLHKNKIKVSIYYSPYKEFQSLMHHKFMIFGSQKSLPNGGVATGSFNCTRAAAERHWENLVILEGTEAISAYQKEFSDLISQCSEYSLK